MVFVGGPLPHAVDAPPEPPPVAPTVSPKGEPVASGAVGLGGGVCHLPPRPIDTESPYGPRPIGVDSPYSGAPKPGTISASSLQVDNPGGTPASMPAKHSWIGLSVDPVSVALAKRLGLPPGTGALVHESPEHGTPSQAAGLHKGDVILAVDGNSVDDPDDLASKIVTKEPGSAASLTVLRDGKVKELSLTTTAGSVVGLTLEHLDAGGPMAKAGFKNGDVVTAVDGKHFKNFEDLKRYLFGKQGATVTCTVVHQIGNDETLSFVVPKEPKGVIGIAVSTNTQGNLAGVVVNEASRDAPGMTAGVKPGDVIYAINGGPVRDKSDYLDLCGGLAAGDRMVLNVLRDGKPMTLSLTVAGEPHALTATTGSLPVTRSPAR